MKFKSSLFTYPSVTQALLPPQNAVQQISSWMTAYPLTLNSSKTDFLLIGLKQNNLLKYITRHSTPPTLLATLASSPAVIIYINFAVSAVTSTPQQLAPLPPPSYASNLITVILFTTTVLSLKQACNRRLQLWSLCCQLANSTKHTHLAY